MKDDVLTLTRLSRFHRLAFLIALTLSFISLIILEEERSSVSEREILAASGPVTIYEIDDGASKPMIFVAHGFAGSRQMLQYISRDLARSGFQVAAFDFYGHGRNTELLSPDVKRIEGTTRQLVRQTQEVVSELDSNVPPESTMLSRTALPLVRTTCAGRSSGGTGNAGSISGACPGHLTVRSTVSEKIPSKRKDPSFFTA